MESIFYREYNISLLQGLKNYLLREADESEIRNLFADALGFAISLAENEEAPEGQPIQTYIEALECLCALCDRMYVARKISKIRMFLSHEEYVQALRFAIKELRAYQE